MPTDVVCLSHLRWGFVHQRPNHLMSRCARERRVFFVEEPRFDVDRSSVEVHQVEDRLHVVTPHVTPGLSNEDAESVQRSLVGYLLERMDVRAPLLWFYTPMALGYARDLRRSGIVYDCMDELSAFHGAPPALARREEELFELADVVFTGGASLYEAKRTRHSRVHAFPSSVDLLHFSAARTPARDPEDQALLGRPRLGFFGVVDERMDLSLVDAIAAERPDFQLVMLGPVVKIDPKSLPRRPNIHWLGQKSYAELPRYAAGWDVAIMPFSRNRATRFISPTKTLEYLAAGKPVVSTSIRDVVRPYGDEGLVRIADEPAAFVAAVNAALAARGTLAEMRWARARDAMLAQTSWDVTWEAMKARLAEIGTFRDELGPRRKPGRDQEKAPCSTT